MQSSPAYTSFHCFLFGMMTSVFLGCVSQATLLPDEGYMETGEGRIWYRIVGEGDQVPLITLHGGPGMNSFVVHPLSALADQRPVVFYDQLGSGLSDSHNDTSLMQVSYFVKHLHQLLNKLEIEQCYLYGTSWGSALALEYYSMYPEKVSALIFSGPYFSTSQWIRDATGLIATLPDTTQQIIRKSEARGDFDNPKYLKAVEQFYAQYYMRTTNPDRNWPATEADYNLELYQYMWGPSEFTSTGILKDYDITSKLDDIAVPTLFLTGEYDEALPATVAKYSKRVTNAAFEIIPDAGHLTLHDNRDENLRIVRLFLSRIER